MICHPFSNILFLTIVMPANLSWNSEIFHFVCCHRQIARAAYYYPSRESDAGSIFLIPRFLVISPTVPGLFAGGLGTCKSRSALCLYEHKLKIFLWQ